MRWKLIILASLVAAVIGFGLWCAITITFFGATAELARHDWIFFASFLLPIGMPILGGVFVYRHTARRRKTQAVITAVLGILLATFAYFAAGIAAPRRFFVPRPYELRPAR